MQIDKSKLKRQELAVERWRNSKEHGSSSNGFGTIWHPTGMGKTFTSLYLVCNKFLDKSPNSSIIVLVHRDELQKQWIKRLSEFVKETHSTQIVVRTVQYFIQNKTNPTCDLLIVDEVHKFYGEDYFCYVDGTKLKRQFLLCLTATLTDKEKRHEKLQNIGCSVVDHILEDEAIRKGWVSKYVEYNLGIDLTKEEIEQYNEVSDYIEENLSKFHPYRFKGAQKVLSGDKEYTGFQYALMWAKKMGYNKDIDTDEQREINEMWNPNTIIGYAKNAMKGIRQRKDFLYTCKTKFDTVVEIIDKFKEDYKIMSFSESTFFADRLFKVLNNKEPDSCVVYHSQLSSRPLKDSNGDWIRIKSGPNKGKKKMHGIKTLKKIYTNLFINNIVKILSTAKALNEGFDCPDINFSVISSRTTNFNDQKQRKGRTIRIIPSKPKSTMILVNVYIKGTRDYDLLKKAQSKDTNRKYWINNINQIVLNPKERRSFDDL